MTAYTESRRAFEQKEIDLQMELIEGLIRALRRDYEKHRHEESPFACSPVGNKGQMEADIKKIRRELMYLSKLL